MYRQASSPTGFQMPRRLPPRMPRQQATRYFPTQLYTAINTILPQMDSAPRSARMQLHSLPPSLKTYFSSVSAISLTRVVSFKNAYCMLDILIAFLLQAPNFYAPTPPAPAGLAWWRYNPGVPPLPDPGSILGSNFSQYQWRYDSSYQAKSYTFSDLDRVSLTKCPRLRNCGTCLSISALGSLLRERSWPLFAA